MAPKKETELVPSRAFRDPFALMRDRRQPTEWRVSKEIR